MGFWNNAKNLAKAPVTAVGIPTSKQNDKVWDYTPHGQERLKAEEAKQSWEQKAAGYEEDLRKGGYDPTTMEGYFKQADTGITASQNEAGESSADSYARRGLGSSGMASAAGADVTLQAAAARATARQRAIDAATAAKRGSTLDAWGVAAKTKGMEFEYQKWLEEKRFRQEALQQQAISDLLTLGGTIGGAAMGRP